MDKLNLTETDAILLTLCNIDDFLQRKARLHSFHVNKNGTTTTVYRLSEHLVSVKRDANNCSFSVQFNLKKHSTVCSEKITPYGILPYAPEDEIIF